MVSGEQERAESLYARFLTRQAAGEEADFESWCAARPEHAPELRRLHAERCLGDPDGSGREPRSSEEGGEASERGFVPEILERLAARGASFGRYTLKDELAAGGQGAVLRVWDEDLQRELAMKVVLPPAESDQVEPRALGRFLEEAQVSGQLDHPGIVPIHELGLDDEGRAYFTMKLVKGHDLQTIFELVRRGEDGWTRTRALRVLLKVCEAMAYAHAKGVIHRDLKPANVMVGRYGEVYVMDWGVARVLGRQDHKDLRIRPPDATLDLRAQRADSSLVTMDGDVVGTPAYMSPEQALGRLDEMGPPADVFSVGAMLYHLLAGHMPYGDTGARYSSHGVWQAVQDGAPSPLAERAPDVPAELVAICEKAMERNPDLRYRDISELGEDLSAFLEHRVVQAYETGALAELRKWTGRNKPLAAALAGAVLVLVVGLVTSLVLKSRSDRNATLAANREQEARQARLKTETTLSDMYTFSGLVAGESGDPAQAVLWFGNAARQAEDDPARRLFGGIRFASWSRTLAHPEQAWRQERFGPKELAFHPDGRYLLRLGHEDQCSIRDLAEERPFELPGDVTGAELPRGEADVSPGELSEVERPITAAVWSPDGTWLALAEKGDVVLYAFPGGEELTRLSHPGPVGALAVSPDGRFLALASDTLRVWDCRAEAFVCEGVRHPAPISELVFSNHGEFVASACADGLARVFAAEEALAEGPLFGPFENLQEGQDVYRSFRPVFVDDDSGFLTRSASDGASWWSLEYGGLARTLFIAERMIRIVPSPSGRSFVACGHRVAEVWDAVTAERVASLQHRNDVYDVAFSPDEESILTVSADRTARVWSLPSGEQRVVVPHQLDVRLGAFAPDGKTFVTAEIEGLMRVWSLQRGDTGEERVDLGCLETFARVSSDGRYLVPSGWNWNRSLTKTRVYDAATGEPAGPELLIDGLLNGAAFSPDADRLAILASSVAKQFRSDETPEGLVVDPGQVEFWDWRRAKLLWPALVTPSEPLGVDWSPDGRTLVVLCGGGQILLVNTADGTVRAELDHGNEVIPGFLIRDWVRFSPDGACFVSWGLGFGLRVWDTATGALKYELEHLGFCHDVDFLAEGNLLATASMDQTVGIWNLATGEPEAPALAHPNWVFSARFSADGRYLLTAGRDGMGRVWDWRQGKLAGPPFAHEDEIFAATFAPDNRIVVTGSRDGVVQAWEWKTGKPVARVLRRQDMVYQLLVPPDGERLIIAGKMPAVYLVDLDELLPASPDARQLALLGELYSGQRVHAGGGVANLTTEEWFERWQEFLELGD